MSLNLKCDEVPLMQTPTEVTMSAYDFVTQEKWLLVLYVYVVWLYKRVDDSGLWPETANNHFQELMQAAQTHGKLTFSII